jgi:uncharacterized protein YjdB
MKTKITSHFVNAFCMSKTLAIVFTLTLLSTLAYSQPTVPFTFVNNSAGAYPDANIYVAIVGMQGANHVWINCKNGAVNLMQTSDNTVQGPVLNGDQGPGGNGKYANCFAKLSEIPNKIVNIPGIAGCRILMSFNSQLYLYFFGPTGGYSAPNLANPNDPNQGIRFEMIELTNASNGLWANTTRVDSYQYPMGLEVWGTNSFYKKVGELMTHAQIISQWQSTAPAAFAGCLNTTQQIIKFPSKTTAFMAGGAQANYFSTYVNNIWSKYASGNLVFSAGDAGTWTGHTSGNVFTFTRASDGQVATISNKPTNTEVMEGSGVMASGAQWDLVVQAQICAAINRHAIDLNLATGATQDFSTPSKFYVTDPYNWYCKFWHRSDISFNSQTYSFCYDDVFNQSSTINAPVPTKATVTIGGFAGTTSTNVAVTGVTVSPTSVSVAAGATSQLTATVAPSNATNKTVSWSSSNAGVATVSSSGLVTGVAAGSATITVTTQDGSKTATSAITVTGTSTGTGVATFYKDCNYGGTAVALPVGTYTLSQLNAKGILNDDVSSVKVNSGYKVTLYQNDNFGGTSLAITANNSCLVSNSFNDMTTSLKIATATAGACSGTATSGDYTYQVSTASNNVAWTFIPGTAIAGSTLCILYVKVGTGAYAGYTMTASGSNFTYTLPETAGAALTFYFTYRVGTTTAERNSSANPHTYTVGTTCSGRAALTEENVDGNNYAVYPNPADDKLFINNSDKIKSIRIYTITGQQMISIENPGSSVNVQSLNQGLHIAVLHTHSNEIVKFKFQKK